MACGQTSSSTGDVEDDTALDVAEDQAPDPLDDDVTDVEPDGERPLWLDVGDVLTLDGVDGSFTVELEGPTGGGSYGIVLMSAHWALGGQYTFSSSMVPGGAGTELAAPIVTAPPEVFWPARHPVMTEADYARVMEWASTHYVPFWDAWPPDPPPAVDEVRQFHVQDASSAVVTIDARCQYVDDEFALWYDITSTPLPVIDDIAEVARLYSEIVMPRERIFFGQESDYNEDGIIHVLVSRLVSDVGASAYFYPCDLIEDPSISMGCLYGNHAEMVYFAPPEGGMMGRPTAIAETLAHETSHLIYFHRKFLLNEQPTVQENVYVTEAGAALAQDVTGMAGGNFFVTQYGLEQIEVFRAIDILIPSSGYDYSRDGSLRGNAYLFLRYLYDQNGGDEVQADGSFIDPGGIAWLNGFVDSADTGIDNVEVTMGGQDIDDILFDFYTALIMSNRGPDSSPITDEPAYNFLPTATDPLTDRTRGVDMFGSFRDMFYLTGPATATIEVNDGILYSTGVQYLTFDASGVVTVAIEVQPEADAWVRLVRLQ